MKQTRTAAETSALIEAILVAEYEAALAEFDRAKENPEALDVRASCERYLVATTRLRNFLAHGEVPTDVVEKLKLSRE